ncbi:MAG: Histidinol-phosphatase, partial [uncultured Solirubrobacteraceae bacterium]
AHRLPRPPAPGRARHARRALLHARQRGALPDGGRRARGRGAGRRGAHLPLHRRPRRLAAPVLADPRARRPRPLLPLRPRGDRPAARHRGGLRRGARGPPREPPRGARVGLRGRLGALPARPLDRHGGLLRVGRRPLRRPGVAPLLRDARRGRAHGALRHHEPPRPREGVGSRRADARGRPAPLLRAGGRGVRRRRRGGRGVHRRAAQAGRRDLPVAAVPRDGRRRGLPDRPVERRAHARAARLPLRGRARAPRRGRRPRARRLRAPLAPPGADRV